MCEEPSQLAASLVSAEFGITASKMLDSQVFWSDGLAVPPVAAYLSRHGFVFPRPSRSVAYLSGRSFAGKVFSLSRQIRVATVAAAVLAAVRTGLAPHDPQLWAQLDSDNASPARRLVNDLLSRDFRDGPREDPDVAVTLLTDITGNDEGVVTLVDTMLTALGEHPEFLDVQQHLQR